MLEKQRPLKVFLCHASADKPKVRDLYRFLKRRGIQPWLDAEDLLPGQSWQVEIPKALSESDAIIICLSKSSVDKEGYIQKEIKFALDKALEMPEGRIFLIPARLEECEVPRSLIGYHWVDLFDESGSAKLMKSLKVRASQLERAAVQVSKQVENSSYLVEKPKQESHAGVSVHVNGDVTGNIIIGNENTTIDKQNQNVQQQIKSQNQDEKALDFLKKMVPFELIKYIAEQDFGNYQYTKIHPLYQFLENSANPALLFVDDETEKLKLKFIECAEGFCNTLMILTQTVNPNTFSKSIVYDEVDEPEKFDAAKDKLNELADAVVQNYNALFKTAIKTKAIGNDHKNSIVPPKRKKPNPAYIVAIIGAIATLLAALIGVLPHFFSPAPAPTATLTATNTRTPITQVRIATFTNLVPIGTSAVSSMPTEISTPVSKSLPVEIIEAKGVSMRLVPAGEFEMGNDHGKPDQMPAHNVYLDSFYIDKNEISNALFQKFVDATGYRTNAEKKGSSLVFTLVFGSYKSHVSETNGINWQEPHLNANISELANHPVTHVSWNDAKAYCEWADSRLPTEAEWEKAARGTDGRTYPWGNNYCTNCTQSNRLATYEIGSYSTTGASPYGVLDMGGNVSEWVEDWYSDTYYSISPFSNPEGPSTGTYHVVRGRSAEMYTSGGEDYSVSTRNMHNAYYTYQYLGFRCARDAQP